MHVISKLPASAACSWLGSPARDVTSPRRRANKKGRKLLGAAGLLLSFTWGPSSNASVIVDQEALVGPPTQGRVSAIIGNLTPPPPNPPLVNAVVAQSVTAGVAGLLNAVEIQGPFSASLIGSASFSLFDGDLTSGGTLVGARSVDLAAMALANSQFASMIDVSSFGFSVLPGSVFSFSLSYLGPSTDRAQITVGNFGGISASGQPIFLFNQYAGGNGYVSNNGNPFQRTAWDVGFRTYVDELATTAVPEPASWALMITGFGLIGGAMRRSGATLSRAST